MFKVGDRIYVLDDEALQGRIIDGPYYTDLGPSWNVHLDGYPEHHTLSYWEDVIDLLSISESKPTNPKDAIGCDKLPLHLWPTTATAMGCLGMLEGMLKYGRDNFRESGVRNTIYIAACLRHIHSYLEGEDHATDSGTPHLANALSCLGIIVDAQAAGKLIDDRKYNGSGYRKLVDNLTPHVRRLKDLFADKNPKHYTIEDNQ